jgi:hypothetical protein
MTRQAAGRQEFVLVGVLSSFAICPFARVKEYRRCTLVAHVVVTPLTPLLDETRVGRSFHAPKHWTNASRRRPQDGCFVVCGEHAVAHHPGEVMTLRISNPFG